jgi:hypothetical protein
MSLELIGENGLPEHVQTTPNKIEWTPYLATAYAEGFLEGEGATAQEQLEAFAYLIKTGIVWKLQGWFGRIAHELIGEGVISEQGDILLGLNDL